MAGRTLAPVHRGTLVAPGRSLQASAQRLDPAARKGEEALPGETDRHREAWAAYDEIGEVRTIVQGSANLISRCVLYAGFVDEQGEDQRLRDENGRAVAPFTEQFVADAEFVLARYQDAGGSQRGLLRPQSENYDVTGDGYLVGWPTDADGKPWYGDEAAKVGERWEFVSRGAIGTKHEADGLLWTIRLAAVGDPTVLPPAANVHRMYRQHPRRPDDAAGWVTAALDICRNLRVFEMAQRAAGRSGIPAKILVAAQQASPRQLRPPGQPAGGQAPLPPGRVAVPFGFPGARPYGGPGSPPSSPDQWAQELDALIGEFVLEAIGDAQSGRTVASPVLTVDERFVEAFNLLDLTRPMDAQLPVALDQSIKRLSTVANANPEMLPGLGDANRWNGVQIQVEAYRTYFKPKIDEIADDWTVDLFWAGMRDLRTLDGRRRAYPEELIRSARVLVDPRPILAEPDRASSSTEGVKIGAVSLAAWRSANGYGEDDAPDPEEQAMLLAAFGRAPAQERDGEVNMMVGAAPFAADVTSSPRVALSLPGHLSPNGSRQAATQADSALSGQALANALADVERTARTRLEEACEATLDAALARAGAKLKTWARRDHDLRAMLAATDARDVASTLGPVRSTRLAAAEFATEEQRREDLFAAVLVTLLASYHRISSAAYDRALRLLRVQIVGPGEIAAAGWSAIPAAEVARNIDQGGVVLRESMLALADREVFDPVTAPDVGELTSFRVPSSVVRRTLAAAGGASVEPGLAPLVTEPGGLAFGPTLRKYEPPVLAWEWDYGFEPRARPYEPHLVLNGQSFSGPEDPALFGVAPDGGPGAPGDHQGCRCDWWPVLADVAAAAEVEA